MAVIPNPPGNTGPQREATQTVANEGLTTANGNGEPTPPSLLDQGIAGATSFTSGITESVTDFVNNPLAALPPIPDISLTSGINTDSFFDLGGQANNLLDGLSIGSLPQDLQGIFGGDFSLDDIADQFGIGGLFGKLPVSIYTNVAPKIEPTSNVLHDYATYTYRLTLGAQDIQDHQLISHEGFTRGTPKITSMLMQSGGGHQVDGTDREPAFWEDFYIEDLKMTTVIGANEQSSGSNAVNISFTIYEPYGVSLIERLLVLADLLGYENYIEIPFIFKIEFIGYDDNGVPIGVIPATTKYIPFKLTYMKFNIDGKGSVYQCDAIPVNHFTYNQTVSSLPEPVRIEAGKVGEFFNGKPGGAPGRPSTGGLTNQINAFHENLAKTTGTNGLKNPPRNAPDRIQIIIHPDIAKHQLNVADLAKVGMITASDQNSPAMQTGRPQVGFNTGTDIKAVIEQIITNSSYMLEQLAERDEIDRVNRANEFSRAEGRGGTSAPKKRPPIIRPQITARYTMLEYDEKANRHAYLATYIVTPKESPAQQSANAGESEVTNIAKEYDYLFTGKNQDILDLNIKFDLAFYNNVASDTETIADGSTSAANKKVTGDDKGDTQTNNKDKLNNPTQEARQASRRNNTGQGAKEDFKKIKATALMKSIMQDSRGDMIVLDMKILGDPSFIKQDDILYAYDGDLENSLTDNGSIKQDSSDLIVRLRFKSLEDIDHATGLRHEAQRIRGASFNRSSAFNGYYRVMMLDNVFSGGQFTQDLVLQRTYVPEREAAEAQAAADAAAALSKESSLVAYGTMPPGTDQYYTPPSLPANMQGASNEAIAGGKLFVNEGTDATVTTITNTTTTVETFSGGGDTIQYADGYGPNTVTPAQQVNESKQLGNGDAVFPIVDEDLIPARAASDVSIESIQDTTRAPVVNADRATSRRGR